MADPDSRLTLAGTAQGAVEPVAIVGMACRLPGADGLDAFWRLLEEGVDAISEVPASRWAIDDFYDPDLQAPGTVSTRWGGFVSDVDHFDAEFFGISPREAMRMDPQQRILLEVAIEALEDAGMVPERLAGSPTGVFVGIFMDDYRRLELLDRERLDGYVGTGSVFCIAANRISYLLDLRGPSLAIDSACSSSLVAVHLACQSLHSGETTVALAGGVNLLLTPEPTIEMTKAGLMSPDGRCRTFDARANGYVRSEGAGMVALKLLSRAQEDGDSIYAVLRGGAVNQDGRTNGITSPNRFAQEEVLRTACRRAGVVPNQVQYVEAHGTGTALGDAIECRALGAVYGEERPASRPLRVGSVKTNIGHLEAAAGVAGLIKVALCLAHGRLPASLHFDRPNPDIPFAELRLEVQDRLGPWPCCEGVPALAGISSFGFGGTNAHFILEEGPSAERPASPEIGRPLHLLTLSARVPEALAGLARRYARTLSAPGDEPIGDLCFSANTGRSVFEHRLAVAAATREEMAEQLEVFARGEPARGLATGVSRDSERPRIAFLFSGQGSQYPGMGRRLFETQPIFRRTLLRCQDALAPHLDRPLLSVLYPASGEEALLDDTAYTQPALFALQLALAELWRSWGVEPDALLGHSVGEYAAACAAGVFTLEEGCALLARRARLMADLPRDGAMAAIFAGEPEVAAELGEQVGEVSIAALNGPGETVISGLRVDVERICARFAERGVKVDRLRVSHAFHSALLDPLLDRFEEAAREVQYAAPRRLLVSNLTGERIAAGEVDAAYLRRHARQPVRFHDGMERLRREGCQVFVEIGPGTTLLGMGAKLRKDGSGVWLPSLRRGRDDWEQILRSLGALFVRGAAVDWQGFDCGVPRRRCRLPTYAFQRKPFWTPARTTARGERPAAKPAPRLVQTSAVAADPLLASTVERLSRAHGVISGSIGQLTGKPFLFLSSKGDALIYLNQRGASLSAIDYTGPREAYVPLVRELVEIVHPTGLEVNLFGVPPWLDPLEALGFAGTRIGAWQDLDVRSFQLAGGSMRRLRYVVQHYQGAGDCETVEYEPGSDPAADREIAAIIDEWAAGRGTVGPSFVENMKRTAFGGSWPLRHRLFLMRRDGATEGAIWLLPAPGLGDYIMDVEAYRSEAPLGCLEFGIVEIVARLRAEGAAHLSLGFTAGTQMAEHPGDDPAVRSFFARLRTDGILDGDANYQFKNKFRPRFEPAFLWRPRGADPEHLVDLLQMLADPFKSDDLAGLLDAPAAAAGTRVAQAARREEAPPLHPLVHRRLDLATPEQVFESELDLALVPYLGDHRLAGTALLPAAGYLEMALAAAAASAAGRDVRIAELSILDVQVLSETEGTRIQMVLHPETAEGRPIAIWSASRGGGEATWTLCASGRVEDGPLPPPTSHDPAALRALCPTELSGEALYDAFRAAGYDYGERLRAVDRVWLGDGEALGRIVAPQGLSLAGYQFHPALLDACLHFAAPLAGRAAGPSRTLIPIGFKGFRSYRVAGRQLWSYARLLPTSSEDLVRLALYVFDDAGVPVAELDELLCKEASVEALSRRLYGDAAAPLLHELEWRPAAAPAAPLSDALWLVFADAQGVGAAVAARLAENGTAHCRIRPGGDLRQTGPDDWEVDPGRSEDFAGLLRAVAPGRPLCLLYLWGLDDVDQRLRCGGVLALLQGLSSSGREGACRIWIATAGAVAAGGTHPFALDQAPLWGLGRVLAREHPELWGGIVDVRAGEADLFASTLLAEVAREDADTFVAHAGGQRYVPRLVRQAGAEPAAATGLSAEGTHLVTGGLGGLGLLAAGWLIERGARHLALISRSGTTVGTEPVLQALRQAGAEVRVLRADVADRDQLSAALAEIAASMPPLCGILHAAGVIDDGVLLQQTWERCERVLAPKVAGALHLHELTRGASLQYFALFSSLTALVGTPGQAAYAAGNAFLDALAHERRRCGLPAVSIGWGPWEAVGMTAGRDLRQRDRWAEQGIAELSVAAGLAALERVLAAGPPQVVVAPLSADRLAASPFAGDPLLAELLHRDAAQGRTPATPDLAAGELAGLDEAAQREWLLRYLRERVALSLQLDAATLDVDRRLNRLGMDSLTAIELRNALKATLGMDLPIVELFTYPTVRQLADVVLARMDGAPSALPPEPQEEQGPQAVQVDQLSDDEVDVLLRQLLAEEVA
ncbi:MAG TPA: SDR family NAD(P)-dependent oxidoreductase [Thermoanaerobaculia bacterium]